MLTSRLTSSTAGRGAKIRPLINRASVPISRPASTCRALSSSNSLVGTTAPLMHSCCTRYISSPSLSLPSRRNLTNTPVRHLSTSPIRLDVPTWPNPPMPQPPVGPSDDLTSGPYRAPGAGGLEGGGPGGKKGGSGTGRSWVSDWAHSPSFQAALTTVVGLGMVFGAGIAYLEWYKGHQLRRIENAFAPGYVSTSSPVPRRVIFE